MKISQNYPDLSHEELLRRFKVRVDTLLGRYSDFISDRSWVTDTHLRGAGRGVKADLQVRGQRIDVEIKLPLLMRAFRGKVEVVVRRQLEQLAEDSSAAT